jgi:hypothetical protein
VFEGVRVAGGDPGAQAAVRAERQHLGPSPARDCRRSVRGAVVDDQHVGFGNVRPDLVQDSRKVRFLVPRRNEDEDLRLQGQAVWNSR